MADNRIGITQLPSDDDGEWFQVTFIDGGKDVTDEGHITSMATPMREADVRDFFGTQPREEVDLMLARARAHRREST